MTLKRALSMGLDSRSDTPKAVKPLRTSAPRHLETGKMGERLAAEYLFKKNYILLDTNVRVKCDEIDIIARDGDELVFVEVRTRSIGQVLPADRSVGPDKLRKLVRAARNWTESRNYDGFWRIDLIAITITKENQIEIEHLSDITEGIV